MRFHRRWFTVALLVSCLALAASPASAQETVRLTFWTFVDAHTDFFLDRAREFNELRPDIDFQLETVVMPFQEMHDQLLIALQTGIGGPDLVDIEIVPFHRYTREPVHLHDLTPIIDRHRDGIIEARLTPYQMHGKQYGVPTHLGAFLAYYNTEIFDEAGVDYNSITLWDDFVEAGKKITRDFNGDGRIDRWMTMLDGGGWFQWFGLIQQKGSGQFDKDGNVILDAPGKHRGAAVPPRPGLQARDRPGGHFGARHGQVEHHQRRRGRGHLDAPVVHDPLHGLHAQP